jgi:hypothetical protein
VRRDIAGRSSNSNGQWPNTRPRGVPKSCALKLHVRLCLCASTSGLVWTHARNAPIATRPSRRAGPHHTSHGVRSLRRPGGTAHFSVFVWLVVDGWCWFVLREKYCWLVADGWFVVREKYCWLVADKPNEQGVCLCGHARLLLVEIGPEGCTPTQQFPKFSPSFSYYHETSTPTRARRGNAKT